MINITYKDAMKITFNKLRVFIISFAIVQMIPWLFALFTAMRTLIANIVYHHIDGKTFLIKYVDFRTNVFIPTMITMDVIILVSMIFIAFTTHVYFEEL